MEIQELIIQLEALIFASDKPLTSLELTDLLNNAFGFTDEEKITLDRVETAVEGIVEKYDSDFYPFQVKQVGGGWQFLTKPIFHKTIAQLNGDKFLKRLSSASMETLSIIAYKQPVTKAEIEAIRGVSSDYAVQKLLEKELIVITGRNESMPGHPLVYATSKSFMDYFGINSADDLPKLKEVFDESIVNPTVMADELAQEETLTDQEDTVTEIVDASGNGSLVVSESGELRVEEIESSESEESDPSAEPLGDREDGPDEDPEV